VLFGGRIVLKATFDQLCITESFFDSARDGASPHIHHRHADSFYVLEGGFVVLVHDEEHQLTAGGYVCAPPEVVHGFRTASPSRFLNFHTPDGGFTESLRSRNRGEPGPFDSVDVEPGSGRPPTDAVLLGPGEGERLNGPHRVATIKAGSGPRQVRYGAGAIWVGNGAGKNVWRIDPATNKARAVPTGLLGPDSLAVSDRALWVAARIGSSRQEPGVSRRVHACVSPSAFTFGSRTFAGSSSTGPTNRNPAERPTDPAAAGAHQARGSRRTRATKSAVYIVRRTGIALLIAGNRSTSLHAPGTRECLATCISHPSANTSATTAARSSTNAPRRATRLSASSSLKTSARQPATYSPTL